MNRIDLELKIKETDPSTFQRMCDYLLEKKGYKVIPLGNCDGLSKTRKGTPDSYSINNSGELSFFEYTTESSGLLEKINGDIDKCFSKSSDFENVILKEIIFFCNSNNVQPEVFEIAQNKCKKKNVKFELFTSFNICQLLIENKIIIKEIFNESFDKEIMTTEEFVASTKKYKGIDHSFIFCARNEEQQKLLTLINENDITLVYGNAGVGKSMLVLKTLENYNPNVFCINQANEESISEISNYIAQDKTIYLFLDDVNEISTFKRLLDDDLILKNNTKIICTVREYALESIKKTINNYNYSFNTILIKALSDEQIETIVKSNLNITNEKWLERISALSRGNPRLAIMAGKVAKEKGVANLIDSNSIMRAYFDLSNDDTIKKLVNEYYDVLGLIAFLKRMDINKIENYEHILSLWSVDKERLNNSLDVLCNVELIDVFENRVIQINDQNLSDYLLENALIQKRVCSISKLIKLLLNSKKKEIIECLNVILNIYSCKSSVEYVKAEVMSAWNDINSEWEMDQFVSVFFSFDSDRAIIHCLNRINKVYSLYTGDYNTFNEINNKNDYVDILFDITRNEKKEEAFDALIYCLNFDDIRDYAFKALKDLTLLKPENFYDDRVNNDIIFLITKYQNKKWYEYILTNMVIEALKYNYEYNYMTNDKQFMICRFSLKDVYKGILEYRNKIWKLVEQLSDENKYFVLSKFVYFYPQEDSLEIFKNDIDNINQLIQTISHVDEIKEVIFKINISNCSDYLKCDNDIKIHNEELLKILLLILNRNRKIPYDERIENRKNEIKVYTETIDLEKMFHVLHICEEVLEKNTNDEWEVYDFLETFISFLNQNMMEALLSSIDFDKLTNRIKLIAIRYGYFNGCKEQCSKIINSYCFNSLALDCYSVICNYMNKEEISDSLKEKFNCFLEKDLENVDVFLNNRRTDTLEYFSVDRIDFVNKVIQVFNKMESNPSKATSWLYLLFNDLLFKPDNLVKTFVDCKRIADLENIILYFMKRRNCYAISRYLFEVVKYDSEFLKKIIKIVLDYRQNVSYEILCDLWNCDNYYDLANMIFAEVMAVKREKHFINTFAIEHIFIGYHNNTEKFLDWAIKRAKIEHDVEGVKFLADLVAMCGENKIPEFYAILIEKQIPLSDFKETLSYPTSNSWTGSEVNVVDRKIGRLKSIIKLIDGKIEYLEYKVCITQYIDMLNVYKKEIRIREKLNYDE